MCSLSRGLYLKEDFFKTVAQCRVVRMLMIWRKSSHTKTTKTLCWIWRSANVDVAYRSLGAQDKLAARLLLPHQSFGFKFSIAKTGKMRPVGFYCFFFWNSIRRMSELVRKNTSFACGSFRYQFRQTCVTSWISKSVFHVFYHNAYLTPQNRNQTNQLYKQLMLLCLILHFSQGQQVYSHVYFYIYNNIILY